MGGTHWGGGINRGDGDSLEDLKNWNNQMKRTILGGGTISKPTASEIILDCCNSLNDLTGSARIMLFDEVVLQGVLFEGEVFW